MSHSKHLITIQDLRRKLDIPKTTLRFWEKELDGIIIPIRTPGGQRRYTASNVEVIKQVNRLRNSGSSISEIREKMKTEMDSLHKSYIDICAQRIVAVVKNEVENFLKQPTQNS